ncbi:MAG: sigma-70 family RNA polymerase sigma factor [Acidobacteriota bacterium]
MTPDHQNERSVTELLLEWRAGDEDALERLIPRVYEELHRLAEGHVRRERPGQTLGATDLVHEAFVRLVDIDVPWQDRAHFLALGARLMRRILLNRSRDKARLKRGAGQPTHSLDGVDVAQSETPVDFLALDQALRELATVDPRKAQVVELTYFVGMTYEELAEALGISRATAHRDLRLARAWLHDRLTGTPSPTES